MKSINLNGNLYYFEDPCVMGILNYTEDSFFDGGKYFNESALIDRVQQMCREGADIIDLGCLSTRPQSQAIDESEELYRIQYVIEILNRFFPNIILSIDTYRASVADYALSHGAAMINDISGGEFDPQIWDVVAKYHVPYVLTHTSGLPANMQQKTNYKNIIDEILLYFSTKW